MSEHHLKASSNFITIVIPTLNEEQNILQVHGKGAPHRSPAAGSSIRLRNRTDYEFIADRSKPEMSVSGVLQAARSVRRTNVSGRLER